MAISEIGSRWGIFEFDSEKSTDFLGVACPVISDLDWQNEKLEYWVLPFNDNAKALTSVVGPLCETPLEIRQYWPDCKFGLVTGGLRGFKFGSLQKEIKINIQTAIEGVAGNQQEREKRNYRAFWDRKPIVIDKREKQSQKK